MTGRRWWALVLALSVIGFGLRAWNLDFDERQHQHPDERHWAITSDALSRLPAPAPHGTVAGPVLDWLDGDRSPANPYRATGSFVYGPATLAVSRSVSGWLHTGAVAGDQPAAAVVSGLDRLGLPLLAADGAPRFDDGYQVDLVGRLLGVVADALMIVVVALIGRRVGGRVVGLVGAGLAATSVLAIQHAHFLGSEPALGLAAALLVLAVVHVDRGPDGRRALVGGGLVGLAAGAVVAMKVTGLALAMVPATALLGLVVLHRRRADWIRLAAAGGGALVAFRVLHPAAFSGLGLLPTEVFLDDLRQNRMASAADSPPALQWAGRTPLLEGLRWLLLFTVGPGTMVAAGVGIVSLARRAAGLDRWTRALLAASLLVPLAVVLRGPVFTSRYFVPMLPALHVVAGFGVVRLWQLRTAFDRRLGRRALASASAGLVGLSALWAVGFVVGVHGREHTRVQASHWIAEHVEPGSVLSSQSWDDGLPLGLEGVDTLRYRSEQLELFGPDSVEKVEDLARSLGRIDYVVESSPRVWGTVTRIPARYPSTIRFFEALDDGTLGFDRVATFDRDIGLGPIRIPDGTAEEAFSVYDHPEVRIWQRVRTVPARERLAALDPIAAASALPVHWQQGSANGAQLLPDERASNEAIGTFDEDFDEDGNPLVHALGWLLVVELIGLASFATLAPVLRSLPDAGAGLAKLLGLVVVTTTVFVAVTWGGLTLSAGLMAMAVAAWLGLGAWCGRRQASVLRELWRDRRRAILQAEVLTLVAFAVLLAVRASDPDLWHLSRGGEKLFELEMLTATLRTRTLPPYDPWYAGGTLNYYYGGYLLLSVPARLLRTAPALAFNLAVPVVASLIVGAAYSAGAAVASTARRGRDGADRVLAVVHRRAGLLVAGVLVLVPNAALVPRVLERITGGEQGALDWWALSRTIPGSPAPTEFPAWSLLFADLHPHLVDLALLISVLPLVIVWHRHLRDDGGRWPAVAVGLVLGALLGAIRAVNTWDLPLAAALVAAGALTAAGPPIWRAARAWWRGLADRTDAMTTIPPWWPADALPTEPVPVAPTDPWPPKAAWIRWSAAVLAVAVVGLGAWAPYAARTEVTDAGIELERRLHTPGASWLAHWSLLAAATAVVVLVSLGRARPRWQARGLMLLGGALVVVGIATPERRVLAATAALAVVVGSALWASHQDGDRSRPLVVPLALVGLGWSMQAGIELFSVINDFDRQNTIFKGWFQSWMLLCLGLGSALGTLAAPSQRLWSPLKGLATRTRLEAASARLCLGVAVLAAVAFAQLAVPARLADRSSEGGFSLDGNAYLDAGIEVMTETGTIEVTADRPLVEWLQAHASGAVVVAEYPHNDYSWSGRMSALTGLTTPLAWPYHQSQQRRAYGDVVRQREADLLAVYQSDDARALTSTLQRFRVAYVVWGATEEALGTPAAERTLRAHPCLTTAMTSGPLFIASVDQTCLADQPGALPLSTRA